MTEGATSAGGRLPSGAPTFLFSDIEGSTSLVQDIGNRYPGLLEAHRKILREAWSLHGGVEVGTEGDSFFVAFDRAEDAVHAALTGQRGLAAHDWPADAVVRVRMGLHTGEIDIADDDYVGLAVHVAARIASAAHGGQILLSGTTRDLVPEVAVMDHGEHLLKDIRTPVPIVQVLDAALPASFPPIRSLSSTPHNLPASVDQFVGRASEVARVLAALETSRIVTLSGPGGSGKTRLALEVAAQVAPAFTGGAWFVELAGATGGEQVEPLVAAALGVSENAGRALRDTLTDSVRSRHLLLVLDNCEHVIDAAADLGAALSAAGPKVRILATSRERLGLRGEQVLGVPPMAVPSEPAAAARSDAVRLFLTRARAVMPTLEPDVPTMATIADICRRLDGLPLAIELAAARTRSLPIDQLADRLSDRFRLLASGDRGTPSRQRTLQAVVSWSYDLLSPPEQVLFRRLSVFQDSFGLEAAEAVCGRDPLDALDVLDHLAALVDKSLVSTLHTEDGMSRYLLLETLREFGLARLADAAEADITRDAEADWALEAVGRLEVAMRRPEQDEALRLLRPERLNLRGALDWMLQRGDLLGALRTVSAVPVGLPSERLRLIEDLLSRLPDAPAHVVGQALSACANIELERGRNERSIDAGKRAEAAFEQAGDPFHAAWARFFQVHPSWAHGDLQRVDELCERLLVEFADLESELGVAYVSWVMSLRSSDLSRAADLAKDACDAFRAIDASVGLAHALEGRALVHLRAGSPTAAIPYATESLERFVRAGNEGCLAHSLEAVAACLARFGDLNGVAELSGAAEAFREATEQDNRPWELGGSEELEAALAGGDAAISAAKARGRSHSLASAADEALRLLAAAAQSH